jgi:molecular chaperone HtpG
MASLNSKAEDMAQTATALPSLPINLEEVKRTVADILTQFGKSLIFHEYTTHDISHVDDMLTTLNWLIPNETQQILYKAEWLMIVLSIYFHDMGLVVTEEEYQKRSASGFQNYCEDKFYSTPGGADYKSKIEALPPDQRDRFLYQEFVRANHARRVKAWIEGRPSFELGYAASQMAELGRLLAGLDKDFRRDLGLVCESHNLDDLHDVTKYRVSYPYGNSENETVNLQYCAAVLRTVDLLQITRRRTPSVLYRLINPSDPISQAEWAKQATVKNVRPKVALDEQGDASATHLSDTIEVFATFTEDNAYFGLTSYLRYASTQLESTYDTLQKARKLTPRKYEFPWRQIDDTNVQVEAALRRPFGFEIDQDKILDLLTGHTLYNDSNVVVRELIQNAIDAVRLQANLDKQDSSVSGKVQVTWDSKKMELTVIDNGTGMTQEIVEKHLLKVGSSRYQDPKFREQFPTFSPISRFGIGVLSSFMVADSVEIVTVSPDEDKARRISLRSVHGKYLIRLLEKGSDPATAILGSHGTSFRLRFRPSARNIDVLETVRRWILFPRCQVTVIVDNGPPENVGYISPKNALEAFVARSPSLRGTGGSKIKVEERTIEGVTVAYALRFSSHYRDWSFVAAPQNVHRPAFQEGQAITGTCIEGIAVEFQTPGFHGVELLAVANAIGQTAPRTNVARSSIEATDEKEHLAGIVYKVLFDAVVAESRRLRTEEAYSLTWSTEQIPYLMAPVISARIPAQYPKSHQAALEQIPMFLVELDDLRVEKSLVDLTLLTAFWTVDSVLSRSVENFIREAKAEITARSLVVVSQGTSSSLPDGPILANQHGADILRTAIGTKFQVTHIIANVSERRLDLRWQLGLDKWSSSEILRDVVYKSGGREMFAAFQALQDGTRRQPINVFVPQSNDVYVSGLADHFAASAYGSLYIMPESSVGQMFTGQIDIQTSSIDSLMVQVVLIEAIAQSIHQRTLHPSLVDQFFKRVEGRLPDKWLAGHSRLATALSDVSGPLRVFNPMSWIQRGPENEIEY